jgi:hypothetical protein
MSDNELNLGNEVRGRIFCTTVFGDSAGEIEIAALTAAQAFFGDGVPLEVVQDYMASGATPNDQAAHDGKKYAAFVAVRAAVQP